MSGAAAEKASPLQDVSSSLKTGKVRLCRMQFLTVAGEGVGSIGTVPIFFLNWMSGPGLRDAVWICLQIS
jgi:hypothetical protein